MLIISPVIRKIVIKTISDNLTFASLFLKNRVNENAFPNLTHKHESGSPM